MVDRILDKGLIIDAYVSVSVVGIELLVIRARIVVSSLETYLRYASAMGLYVEPGGVIQRGASHRKMGSNKEGLPKQQQEQQGQQQPVKRRSGKRSNGRKVQINSYPSSQ